MSHEQDTALVLGSIRDHAAGGVGFVLVSQSIARSIVNLVAGLLRGDDEARACAAGALGIDTAREEE